MAGILVHPRPHHLPILQVQALTCPSDLLLGQTPVLPGGRCKALSICNLLLRIARFPEGDPAILKGQGGQASIEISTRDITKVKN